MEDYHSDCNQHSDGNRHHARRDELHVKDGNMEIWKYGNMEILRKGGETKYPREGKHLPFPGIFVYSPAWFRKAIFLSYLPSTIPASNVVVFFSSSGTWEQKLLIMAPMPSRSVSWMLATSAWKVSSSATPEAKYLST